MLTSTASSPETSNIRISLKSEDGLKKWLDLDPGSVLLFSNLFSRRCLLLMISVVGAQNNWIPGISELANSNRDFGDKYLSSDRSLQACISSHLFNCLTNTITCILTTMGRCKEMPFCIQCIVAIVM